MAAQHSKGQQEQTKETHTRKQRQNKASCYHLDITLQLVQTRKPLHGEKNV
jgi:hypothetical protein